MMNIRSFPSRRTIMFTIPWMMVSWFERNCSPLSSPFLGFILLCVLDGLQIIVRLSNARLAAICRTSCSCPLGSVFSHVNHAFIETNIMTKSGDMINTIASAQYWFIYSSSSCSCPDRPSLWRCQLLVMSLDIVQSPKSALRDRCRDAGPGSARIDESPL